MTASCWGEIPCGPDRWASAREASSPGRRRDRDGRGLRADSRGRRNHAGESCEQRISRRCGPSWIEAPAAAAGASDSRSGPTGDTATAATAEAAPAEAPTTGMLRPRATFGPRARLARRKEARIGFGVARVRQAPGEGRRLEDPRHRRALRRGARPLPLGTPPPPGRGGASACYVCDRVGEGRLHNH